MKCFYFILLLLSGEILSAMEMQTDCNNKGFLCYDELRFYQCVDVGNKTVTMGEPQHCPPGLVCNDNIETECEEPLTVDELGSQASSSSSFEAEIESTYESKTNLNESGSGSTQPKFQPSNNTVTPSVQALEATTDRPSPSESGITENTELDFETTEGSQVALSEFLTEENFASSVTNTTGASTKPKEYTSTVIKVTTSTKTEHEEFNQTSTPAENFTSTTLSVVQILTTDKNIDLTTTHPKNVSGTSNIHETPVTNFSDLLNSTSNTVTSSYYYNYSSSSDEDNKKIQHSPHSVERNNSVQHDDIASTTFSVTNETAMNEISTEDNEETTKRWAEIWPSHTNISTIINNTPSDTVLTQTIVMDFHITTEISEIVSSSDSSETDEQTAHTPFATGATSYPTLTPDPVELLAPTQHIGPVELQSGNGMEMGSTSEINNPDTAELSFVSTTTKQETEPSLIATDDLLVDFQQSSVIDELQIANKTTVNHTVVISTTNNVTITTLNKETTKSVEDIQTDLDPITTRDPSVTIEDFAIAETTTTSSTKNNSSISKLPLESTTLKQENETVSSSDFTEINLLTGTEILQPLGEIETHPSIITDTPEAAINLHTVDTITLSELSNDFLTTRTTIGAQEFAKVSELQMVEQSSSSALNYLPSETTATTQQQLVDTLSSAASDLYAEIQQIVETEKLQAVQNATYNLPEESVKLTTYVLKKEVTLSPMVETRTPLETEEPQTVVRITSVLPVNDNMVTTNLPAPVSESSAIEQQSDTVLNSLSDSSVETERNNIQTAKETVTQLSINTSLTSNAFLTDSNTEATDSVIAGQQNEIASSTTKHPSIATQQSTFNEKQQTPKDNAGNEKSRTEEEARTNPSTVSATIFIDISKNKEQQMEEEMKMNYSTFINVTIFSTDETLYLATQSQQTETSSSANKNVFTEKHEVATKVTEMFTTDTTVPLARTSEISLSHELSETNFVTAKLTTESDISDTNQTYLTTSDLQTETDGSPTASDKVCSWKSPSCADHFHTNALSTGADESHTIGKVTTDKILTTTSITTNPPSGAHDVTSVVHQDHSNFVSPEQETGSPQQTIGQATSESMDMPATVSSQNEIKISELITSLSTTPEASISSTKTETFTEPNEMNIEYTASPQVTTVAETAAHSTVEPGTEITDAPSTLLSGVDERATGIFSQTNQPEKFSSGTAEMEVVTEISDVYAVTRFELNTSNEDGPHQRDDITTNINFNITSRVTAAKASRTTGVEDVLSISSTETVHPETTDYSLSDVEKIGNYSNGESTIRETTNQSTTAGVYTKTTASLIEYTHTSIAISPEMNSFFTQDDLQQTEKAEESLNTGESTATISAAEASSSAYTENDESQTLLLSSTEGQRTTPEHTADDLLNVTRIQDVSTEFIKPSNNFSSTFSSVTAETFTSDAHTQNVSNVSEITKSFTVLQEATTDAREVPAIDELSTNEASTSDKEVTYSTAAETASTLKASSSHSEGPSNEVQKISTETEEITATVATIVALEMSTIISESSGNNSVPISISSDTTEENEAESANMFVDTISEEAVSEASTTRANTTLGCNSSSQISTTIHAGGNKPTATESTYPADEVIKPLDNNTLTTEVPSEASRVTKIEQNTPTESIDIMGLLTDSTATYAGEETKVITTLFELITTNEDAISTVSSLDDELSETSSPVFGTDNATNLANNISDNGFVLSTKIPVVHNFTTGSNGPTFYDVSTTLLIETNTNISTEYDFWNSTAPHLSENTVRSTVAPVSPFVCHSTGKFPDPTSCSVFHLCINAFVKYIDVPIECPRSTRFDVETKRCTKRLVQCPGDTPITCTSSGAFIHPTDCSRYYKCFWRTFYTKFKLWQYRCPPQMRYDSFRGRCIRSSVDECENSFALTSFDQIPFECTEEGRFPVEYSCSEYYECKKQRHALELRIKSCKSDKLFDREWGRCRKAHLVVCPFSDDDSEESIERSEEFT